MNIRQWKKEDFNSPENVFEVNGREYYDMVPVVLKIRGENPWATHFCFSTVKAPYRAGQPRHHELFELWWGRKEMVQRNVKLAPVETGDFPTSSL